MRKCPSCKQEELIVIDSRKPGDGSYVRRRLKCKCCGERFTSYETHEVKPETVQALIESLQPEPKLETHPDVIPFENKIIELETLLEHEKGLRKEAQSQVDELELQNLFDHNHFVPGQSHLQREFARLQGRLDREKQIRNEFEEQLKVERKRIIALLKEKFQLKKALNET